MKKTFKKWMAYGLAATLFVTALSDLGTLYRGKTASAAEEEDFTVVNKSTTADITVPDAAAAFQDLTAEQIIQEAGIGWNLGNTLDAWTGNNFLTGETLWQNVTTTKALIKSVHDMGFNTIRIPVTWGANINEDYAFEEEWLSRVLEVVDFAISQVMYVMLNVHHDGCRNDDPTPHGWLNVDGSDEDFEVVREKFSGLWTTIADRFKNYDEHLMFAAMNEVFGDDPLQDGNDKAHNNDCLGWKPQYGYNDAEKELLLLEYERIGALNQDFVDVVRGSGGNNDQRWIIVQPHNTSIHAAFDAALGFEMPIDPADRIMMEVHDYDSFILSKATNENEKDSYAQQFARLKRDYVDKGVPVVIGEFGFTGKSDRSTKFEGVGYLLKKYDMIGCVWDNNGAGNYQVIDRVAMKPSDTCVAALMRGFFNVTDVSQIVAKAEIVPMTALEVDTDSVEVVAGETASVTAQASAPADTNDTIVWSTSNANVATVYNGKIQANAPGTATITAKALSGTAAQEIAVTVKPSVLDDPTTDINIEYENLSLLTGRELYVTPEIWPVNNEAEVKYVSENESVVNVSCDGRVLVKGIGSTNIIISTTDGKSVTIPVYVEKAPVDPNDITGDLRLVIRAQYNTGKDETYYGDTIMGSDVVGADADGTYTLTLDCAKDLPEAAAGKGVTNLNGLGALYIYDYDVAMGNAKKSNISADARVSYTSIKINGTELLTGETEDYNAVKGSIFDTGNPFNAWDGSVVPEDKISVKSNSISFPDIENPTQVEVTLKIKNFKGDATPTEEPSEAPSEAPSESPSESPSGTTTPGSPSVSPSTVPSVAPSTAPSVAPTTQPKVNKPAKVAGVKLKVAKKKLTVSWKKQTGMKYKIAYSTSKAKLAKLKNGKVSAKGVKVVDSASAKKVLKKLKAKKKYYVKVCAYTTINGKKTYGKWSAVKNKKVK